MFTGLVEGTATVCSLIRENAGLRLGLDLGTFASDGKLGDSICISGCCLTIVEIDQSLCTFELGSETLSKTKFKAIAIGDPLNIERSLAVGDRMGGHFVTGHVDGLGTLLRREEEGPWSHFHIAAPASLLKQMVPKGSITVDGVSLTIVDVHEDSFSLALIPHTLQVTTLGRLKVGDFVHLETDILAKYAQRAVSPN